MGLQIAVRPKRQGRNSDGEIVWECEAPDTGEVWHVFKLPPNDKQLQYLYDQLAGRSAAKANEAINPDIRVIFGAIDCTVEADQEPETEQEQIKRPTLGLSVRRSDQQNN